MPGRLIAFFVGAALFAQTGDIPGWNGVAWGAQKQVALAALRAAGVRECPACAPADALEIDPYRQNGLVYRVKLTFVPGRGLASVTMSAPDDRESFQKVLTELTVRYGRPALRSEYDGDREATRTTWEWVKPRGKASLAADDGRDSTGDLIVRYEARF